MIAVVNRHIGVLNKLLQYNPKLHLRNSVRLFTLCHRLLYIIYVCFKDGKTAEDLDESGILKVRSIPKSVVSN